MTDEKEFHEQMVFAREVLNIFFQLDIHDDLFWRVDNGMPTFYVKCSDLFSWGTADLEQILPGNLAELLLAYRDIITVSDTIEAATYCGDLFTARLRKMRPQGAAYPVDKRLWALFDACGPERKIGLGNPKTHPGA